MQKRRIKTTLDAWQVRESLTIWDRTVFGSIAAFFGAGVGVVVAVPAMLLRDPPAYNTLIVLFSGLFVFVVGAVRGSVAGEFIGEALSWLCTIIVAGSVALGGGVPTSTNNPPVPVSLWLLVAFVVGVVLLGVFA